MSARCPKCGKSYRFNGKSFKAHTEGYFAYVYAGNGKPHTRVFVPPVCDLSEWEAVA